MVTFRRFGFLFYLFHFSLESAIILSELFFDFIGCWQVSVSWARTKMNGSDSAAGLKASSRDGVVGGFTVVRNKLRYRKQKVGAFLIKLRSKD